MTPTVRATPSLVLAALAIGLSACSNADGQPKGEGGGAGPGGGEAPPMPVEVVVARADTVVDAIIATGQIEAVQSIELRPEVEGRIAQILVR